MENAKPSNKTNRNHIVITQTNGTLILVQESESLMPLLPYILISTMIELFLPDGAVPTFLCFTSLVQKEIAVKSFFGKGSLEDLGEKM
jgi:hypothetical protein